MFSLSIVLLVILSCVPLAVVRKKLDIKNVYADTDTSEEGMTMKAVFKYCYFIVFIFILHKSNFFVAVVASLIPSFSVAHENYKIFKSAGLGDKTRVFQAFAYCSLALILLMLFIGTVAYIGVIYEKWHYQDIQSYMFPS